MKDSKKAEYNPFPLEKIDHAARQSIALARKTHKRVTLRFQDVALRVTGEDKQKDIVARYWNKTYSRSPLGKAAAAQSHAEENKRMKSLKTGIIRFSCF